MANTYYQIYVQMVFTVQGKQNLIPRQYREELQKYITGIIQNRHAKLLSIFCNPDHIHLLVGIKPNVAVSDLVRDVKAGSSHFINEKKWICGKFCWQEGFGAFSYSKSQIGAVAQYIANQEQHHKKICFKDEYVDLLRKFEIDYDEKYLFQWIE